MITVDICRWVCMALPAKCETWIGINIIIVLLSWAHFQIIDFPEHRLTVFDRMITLLMNNHPSMTDYTKLSLDPETLPKLSLDPQTEIPESLLSLCFLISGVSSEHFLMSLGLKCITFCCLSFAETLYACKKTWNCSLLVQNVSAQLIISDLMAGSCDKHSDQHAILPGIIIFSSYEC